MKKEAGNGSFTKNICMKKALIEWQRRALSER